MTQEKQNQESKRDEVRSYLNDIPADKVREPNMPVDTYIGEARNTISAARLHWHRFEAINFPEKWLRQAEAGLLVLSEAQTSWVASRDSGRSETERALIDSAHTLRDKLLTVASYVYRHDDNARQKLAAVREGEGLYDLCQDLKDVAGIIETNRAGFEDVGFDFGLCERAKKTSDELGKVHATATAEKMLSDAKQLRDRAFTWTDQAVDEVRAAGLYALADENRPDWLAMFRSRYAIAKARRNREKTSVSAASAANPTNPITNPVTNPTGPR